MKLENNELMMIGKNENFSTRKRNQEFFLLITLLTKKKKNHMKNVFFKVTHKEKLTHKLKEKRINLRKK